jgi:hypothetical protein
MRFGQSLKGAVIMRHLKNITVALVVALLVLVSRSARADEFDQSMIFTFSGPVAIPGAVLPAGTYQFKLADPGSTRSVVQIANDDGSHVYATLDTIPDERPEPTDEPAVTFEKRADGSPEAIRTVFYPGETTGMQFVYPADRK